MKHLLLCGLLLLGLGSDALAHRLDECLQATRVAVATNRIDLSIDLTPGVAVASIWLVAVDTDGDGRISTEEGDIYARRVLEDVRLALDEEVMALHLVDASFPALPEIRAGLGVVRIRATTLVRQLAVGEHVLTLTNSHLPKISAYLVNARVPKNSAIKLTKQDRNELQTHYKLKFSVGPR